jgi:hypothetical protein
MKPDMLGTLLGDKAQSTWFDNAKLKRFVPGFRCAIPFTEGIRETVAWFDAEPARQAVDAETEEFWDRCVGVMEAAKAG